jgi:hypothetical protein
MRSELLPGDAEPGEICEDLRDEPRPRAARIDVLDAHQEPSAAGPRLLVADERGEGVAQMHLTVGAGRKAEHGRIAAGSHESLEAFDDSRPTIARRAQSAARSGRLFPPAA